ncbi:trans-acting enoyl reductase family protein [Streptomyces sp. ISL-86]|uniref:saccharopine dehydrogenase family protein n=1 Tax=Streptomyces sp. ISL-86 TaxID=2819187 RepID=UPI001BEC5077|nr:saccharopine dehydrogenase NADP-binding domain-containing protein [Streptomyces sp. ISL-86]MBT2455508.1 saccharopine dehydrogenase NADP-binding domain-containing protein [Streptomyces sp. ISL-86]
MGSTQTVAVFGAYGHTARFVVAELLERGFTPILSGRDTDKLRALGESFPGLEVRPASVDDAASLDRALSGAAALINCAGPFAATTAPVIEAALRARIPYVDIAAEVEAVADTFAHFDERARDAGIVVVPAMAFYGGLGDLLATAAMGAWAQADEVSLAFALSSWHPTAGTRKATQVSRRRRDNQRLVFTDGRLELRTDQAPTGRWSFPAPVGEQAVLEEFTTADSVTIPRHLKTSTLHTRMTVEAIKDVLAPDAAPPVAVDERGRSDQTFLVDVVVRSGDTHRRAVARGRDIYAISAPLAVEAVSRVLAGQVKRVGAATAGEIFDAPGFLDSLSPHLLFELGEVESGGAVRGSASATLRPAAG